MAIMNAVCQKNKFFWQATVGGFAKLNIKFCTAFIAMVMDNFYKIVAKSVILRRNKVSTFHNYYH